MAANPCAIISRYIVMCEAICCLGILEAAASVSGDPGVRVNESAPRAAATTRAARTPTAAQYHTKSQQSTGNPPAACVCWTNCSSSSVFLKQRLLWKANTSEQTMLSQQHTCGSCVGVENSDNAAEL